MMLEKMDHNDGAVPFLIYWYQYTTGSDTQTNSAQSLLNILKAST